VARLAVLASGDGGNFEAIVAALRAPGVALRLNGPDGAGASEEARHECVLLVHDRADAYAAARARLLGVGALYVSYAGRARADAEHEIAAALDEVEADLVALAGFMRLLSPGFVRARTGRILNVHPSLLPRWPGKDSILRAWKAGDREYGVTVHVVDEGMDSGPVLAQESFRPPAGAGLHEIETLVHEIEHELYPRTLVKVLDGLEAGKKAR
jgi:phosphoribosylglycinamide formyltransferase-1